jgi:hypothetical protein
MIAGAYNGQQQQQQQQQLVPTRFLEQLARGVWFGPVVEKLRLIQLNLNKLTTTGQQTTVQTTTVQQQTTTQTGYPLRNNNTHRFWAEKKTGVVSQFIQTFTQFQTEAAQLVGGQQSLFGLFEHIKMRQVLSHLRELKERECMEIIRFFQEQQQVPTYGQR